MKNKKEKEMTETHSYLDVEIVTYNHIYIYCILNITADVSLAGYSGQVTKWRDLQSRSELSDICVSTFIRSLFDIAERFRSSSVLYNLLQLNLFKGTFISWRLFCHTDMNLTMAAFSKDVY